MDHHLIYKGNENRKKIMEFSGKINELFSYYDYEFPLAIIKYLFYQ